MDEFSSVMAVWSCVDSCLLFFDLIFCSVSWILRSLYSLCSSLHSATVSLTSSGVSEYGNIALFSFLTATEAVSSGIHGAIYTLETCVHTMGGVLESFKMVGHLFCHVAWRTKELLHRSVISGTSILRQTCDGICIVLSLVVYFVNTVVNILLISTQNCLSFLATVCETLATPLHKILEFALTILTFLYSCLLGVTVLLWTPCQLILDIIFTSLQLTVTFLTANIYTFIISTIAFCIFVLLNTRLQMGRPGLFLVNFLHFAQVTLQRVLDSIRGQAFQILNHLGRNRTQNGGHQDAPRSNETNQEEANNANNSSLASQNGGRTDDELFRMLKEQEERKKCVICQDLSKNVLLLPCRHLCLCCHCADILTQSRPLQQRLCPLCRQPISQTIEVFL